MPSSETPPTAASNSNPLVALAIAAIGAILYVLQCVKWLVGWVTITVPSMIVRMLHYSFTISLTFPVLLTLFLASCGAAFFVIRYRYLARYTQLKEPALPPPSPPSLPADLPDLDLDGLPSDLHPARLQGARRRNSAFHNYLDDFLSAIRIFGYLEKPVFHELSRHLQTRRLGAGETLEIGGGDFWCVVEGKVQVFAPSSSSDISHPPSPDPFNTGKSTVFNGYHLLNEVSTGGTLSSLFSILNLFVEDVKISWTPPADGLGSEGPVEEHAQGSDPDETFSQTARPKKSRQNSDVSQLDEGTLGSLRTGDLNTDGVDSPPTPVDGRRAMQRKRSSSLGTASNTKGSSPTAVGSASPKAAEAEDLASPSSLSPVSANPGVRSSASNRSSPGFVSPSRGHPRFTPAFTPLSKPNSRQPSQRPPKRQPTGTAALKGSIARATTDTTLAVIPAEAFRKLTRKFPKASGTVVQVVLERFSRVTFMTAHKFLGLTKEILRSESALNSMVSHPLPRDFYTGGGMQALRDRFHPPARNFGTTQSSPNGRNDTASNPVKSRDYFNYVPASPTVKAPSLPSITPKNQMTPATHAKVLKSEKDLTHSPTEEHEAPVEGLAGPKPADAPLPPPEPAILSPDVAARQTRTFVRRHSAMRKMVAAGDLAMTRNNEEGGAYYRPYAQTPGLPRMDTWRGRISGSTTDLPEYKQNRPRTGLELEDEAELREAVMVCIARSVGLLQPNVDDQGGLRSFAPSMSASMVSTPNSPMFPAHGASMSQASHPVGGRRAPFGNVLDMMNAASHNDSLLEGMLREAVLKSNDRDDDASSISMSQSHHDSASIMAGAGDRGVLRELEGKVQVMHYAKGTQLVGEGEKCPGLYYVIDGFLEISLPGGKKDKEERLDDRPFAAALGQDDPRTPHPSHPLDATDRGEHLFEVKPGGIAGYLASLCHTDSYVSITAKTDVYVGFLPTHTLERIMERHPLVLLTLAKRLLSLLSPLVLHIDAALDWMQLGAKDVLYEKGAKATDFYIVINGRLRSLDKRGDNVEVLREYGQGDSIGELEVITGVHRTDTVHAIRDSELVRIPAALFDAISQKHPATTMQFLKIIAGRVRTAVKEQSSTRIRNAPSSLTKDINLKTVCILGRDRNVPVAQVAAKLKMSLEELGASTSYLDQGTVMRHLGRHAFARIGKLKIAGWLADQEQHHRIVLYVADTPPSSQWTLTCIRQADLVLVVGMGDDPTLGEYEKLMLATKTTARKELILLHDERAVAPGSTRPWLKARAWVQAHHHVELPGVVITNKTPVPHDAAAVAAFKHLRENVRTRLEKYRAFRPLGRPRRPPHMNDFARIARRMCGKQIGLCLGGGGARGISHLGMLQALEEYGVPIDAIGGCSIGSFVGGLYARETDLMQAAARTKQFAGRMGSVLRILSDLTYPYASYTTGHEFNRGIYKAFFNTHIEDCWIPFFANSTNITHSRMEVHRTGYAWRYVRASMTLAGLLPPLSDNGDLLVDGGYMDNTPIGPLQSSGISDIIVVDVGGIDDTSPRNYGDSVSGWWILLNRFNPFYQRAVLSMTEVSGRLAYVSSFKTLEDVKNTPGVLYTAMPVQNFETLGGFKQFKEVFEVGLEAGREQLKRWKEEGRLMSGLVDDKKGRGAWEKGNRVRRMSI